MTIERMEIAQFRLPLEAMGDAGHGTIDGEDLITVELHADGLVGHGYTYTLGRGGRGRGAVGPARPARGAAPVCGDRGGGEGDPGLRVGGRPAQVARRPARPDRGV